MEKIDQFTSDRLIYEWLCVPSNRNRLPMLQFKSRDAYETVMQFATAYSFAEDGSDTVYFLGVNYYRITLESQQSKIVLP